VRLEGSDQLPERGKKGPLEHEERKKSWTVRDMLPEWWKRPGVNSRRLLKQRQHLRACQREMRTRRKKKEARMKRVIGAAWLADVERKRRPIMARDGKRHYR